ncbi:MAG: sulfur carrier protein ThiS [Candidatus Omnitrophica bacterium]|nr:sulfur carrier protein ThiS [Candidatus Omnitrophota bacterium]MBU1524103.1 sulfur carrier protein ThiS [Candidatus Omnitrophota bacterium]MBU2436500.1 sulfur carrier protein ThiS [Candidatus Omnitrophota bacterium]
MQIFINGKKEEIEDDMSISKLIKAKKIRPEVVTVELNDKIIEKGKYSEIVLKPEDRLEFVYYMGGGEENAK